MKYTAEEVRKSADWLYQWERKAGARNARAMLTAYADLLEQIKADEGVANKLVVPVAWMCETVNGYKVFNAEGPSFPCNAGVVSELFTHPPAQAAQSVDVEAIRKVIEDMECSSLSAKWTQPNRWAERLAAALQEKGNG